jgi:dTDP-4-amino-4,6-dideoxygalactose transaminase
VSSRPAILGGTPLFQRERVVAWPAFSERTIEGAVRLLREGRLMDAATIEAFERELARYSQAEFAVLVSSGSAAVELALEALGVGRGDEVIVPAVGFTSDLTSVLRLGARPVLADVDSECLNLDPEALRARLGPRTKAAIAIHHLGVPCDMQALRRATEAAGVALVEDAAHAHGSEERGRRAGALGTVGTFSFDQNKVLSCGQGGALVVDDGELLERLRAARDFGRVPRQSAPGWVHHAYPGTNHKTTALPAALGLGALAELDEGIARRERAVQRLQRGLAGVPGIRPARRPAHATRITHYQSALVVEPALGIARGTLIKALLAEGIPCGSGWAPFAYSLAAWPEVREQVGELHDCPVAERESRRRVLLPLPLLMSGDAAIDATVEALERIVRHAEEISAREAAEPGLFRPRSDIAAVDAGLRWLHA